MVSTRRKVRELAFQTLYQRSKINVLRESENYLFQSTHLNTQHYDFYKKLVIMTWDNIDAIDAIIQKKLTNWKQYRLSSSLNTLLRMSIAEMLYFETKDMEIILNESLEICRKYIGESSIKICNGVLDAAWREIQPSL